MNVNCKVWWRLERSMAWDVRMSMSAHVPTMRGQERHQDEQQKKQVRPQEELVMKEKALRDTQIRSIHEMEKLKRARELRVDEFSVQKLRESHDAIQQLTSQIQELQERVNCMNDSGKIQDTESIYSGKWSHVPSQPTVVPSPRSMLSRDRSMPFDTWNVSGTQGYVFWQSTSFVRLNTDTLSGNSSLYESRCHRFVSSAGKYRATCRERWRTNWEARHQCRCLREGRQPWILSYQRKFHSILWLYSKDCRYRSLSSITSPHLQRFHVGRHDSKTQVSSCSEFSLGSYVMDQSSWDGRFRRWIKILAISFGEGFPEFWSAGRQNCFRFELDHSEFLLVEEGQSGGTEGPKRGSVSSWKTDRFHDLRQLSCSWRSWYSIKLCWFILCYSSWGIRYKIRRSSTVDVRNSIRWYLGKSVRNEDTRVWSTQNTVLELYDMEIHQKIPMPNYKKLKTMVRRSIEQKRRLRNFYARNERIETGAVVTSRRRLSGTDRGKGVCHRWKARRDQCSFGQKLGTTSEDFPQHK